MIDLKNLKTVEEVQMLGRAVERLAMATERLGIALEHLGGNLEGTITVNIVGELAQVAYHPKVN